MNRSVHTPQRPPIPVTRMHQLYVEMRKASQKNRLEVAEQYIGRPGLLAAAFAESVADYERGYSNIDEPFHPKRRHELRAPVVGEEIRRGYDLAGLLAAGRGDWAVAGSSRERRLRYVDHEIPPLRTTGGARFANGSRGRGLVADLLLVTPSGVPVIGEIKAATAKRYDTDAVMALIQALALAEAFAPGSQRERLAVNYPHAGIRTAGALGIATLVVKPVASAKATYQKALGEKAYHLAHLLLEQPGITPTIGWLDFVDVTWDGSSLSLRRARH